MLQIPSAFPCTPIAGERGTAEALLGETNKSISSYTRNFAGNPKSAQHETTNSAQRISTHSAQCISTHSAQRISTQRLTMLLNQSAIDAEIRRFRESEMRRCGESENREETMTSKHRSWRSQKSLLNGECKECSCATNHNCPSSFRKNLARLKKANSFCSRSRKKSSKIE